MPKKTKKNEIIISRTQIIGLVITAVIGSAVTTTFGLIRIANSDHFTLLALSDRVEAVENSLVPRTEFDQSVKHIEESLRELKANDSSIIQRIDRLLEKL